MEKTRLSSSEKIIFLHSTDLCAGLSAEVTEAISSITEECNYEANEILFHEGDTGDSLYLLVDGDVSIQKDETSILMITQPDICIGEMAILEKNTARSATVKATEATKLLRILRHDFIELLEWDFQAIEGVFRMLNAKLRNDLKSLSTNIGEEAACQESMRIAKTVQQSVTTK